MDCKMRTMCGLNKGFTWKFKDNQLQHILEKDWKIQWSKFYNYTNKDEDIK